MAAPEFTVEFTIGVDDYDEFIRGLRQRLGETTLRNGLRVLPPQQSTPSRWFDIVVRTDSYAVRLRIRLDNLYLDAYQGESSSQCNKWWEFPDSTRPNTHLIQGSSFLPFDGNYDGLERKGGYRDQIMLGSQQLINAVNQLATVDSSKSVKDKDKVRATSLIVVIQMFCESIRFTHISDFLNSVWYSGARPTSRVVALENGWQVLSGRMLHDDADPNGHPFQLNDQQPNRMEIVTAADVIAVIGILLNYKFIPKGPRMAMANAAADAAQEEPKVEVFSVRIKNYSGNITGTITVADGLSCQYIYNRESGNPESIPSGGDTVLLTGPARSISAYGSFALTLDLQPVVSGVIPWNVFHAKNVYDTPLYDTISGSWGSATVNYVVISDGEQTNWEAWLEDDGSKEPVHLYGLITARSDKFVNESDLFRRSRNEYVDVLPGHQIPLSRSVVSMPVNSNRIARAELYSRNDVIVKGTATFTPPARLSNAAAQQKKIPGKRGGILLKVT